MSENKDDKFKIIFGPKFTEALSGMPEEERKAILEALPKITQRLAENPFSGTPLNAPWYIILINFCRRVIRDFELLRRRLWTTLTKTK